tara:strand:+ start:3272 stop:3463 length:192 start_codon:yes stop_codon:yes gene_type:complete
MTDPEKHIVVEVRDGIIQAVYCPDETYVVDVLDHDVWDVGVDESLDNYYKDVEKSTENLKDLY